MMRTSLRTWLKRTAAAALALCLAAGVLPLQAACVEETEPAETAVQAVDVPTNTSMETALPVTPGETVTVPAADLWYYVETTKPGQFMRLFLEGGYDVWAYTADGKRLSGAAVSAPAGSSVIEYTTGSTGKYYILVHISTTSTTSTTFSVQLLDNDSYEPNNTAETAASLGDGQTANILLGGADSDFFFVQTTEPGQDVAVTVSGFSYAVKGSAQISFDGSWNQQISGNGTVYFHAPQAGRHTIGLSGSTLSLSVSVEILDGDNNEPNDTRDAATTLHVGTDAYFSVGGLGDEDWFTFEAALDAGESQKLYTLNFLDLNTDYSDQFCYDVYAPDGTVVVTGTKVNIKHAKILACTQQGVYVVRVYTAGYTSSGQFHFDNITRSTLRIRVDEGGADPYESNNTWLEAADISVEQPVQFILSDTTDIDWFRFQVPEADMTLKLTVDRRTVLNLYSGEALQKYGVTHGALLNTNYYSSPTIMYYKFAEPGIYYMATSTEQAYTSPDLRTMELTLERPRDVENNDTWKTATPIYEGVPQAFDLTASNDVDWFKLEVPAGVSQLVLDGKCPDGNYSYSIFRESDFESSGDNAGPIASGTNNYASIVRGPSAGTYYVACRSSVFSRTMNCSLRYMLTNSEAGAPGGTIAAATPLPEGEWTEWCAGGVFSLGQLKAGDELRIDTQNVSGLLELLDSAGTRVANINGSSSYVVPADGEYYLKMYSFSPSVDEDGNVSTYRLRYDVGDTVYDAAVIEGPDEITLRVGETKLLDLRIAPYDAKLGQLGTNVFLYTLWTSGDSSVVERTGGNITGLRAGDTTVTVRCSLNTTTPVTEKDITVHVIDPTAGTAESLTITGAPAEALPLGGTVTLAAALTPADSADAVTWTSSDTSVLYVNGNGRVTAVGYGSATITATAASGVSDSVTITTTAAPEKAPVKGVRLDQYSVTLYAGEEGFRLTAAVEPENATDRQVTWASSNIQVASVDQKGVVMPLAAGVTVVTAQVGDYKASCVVTVQPERVRVTGIHFNESFLAIPMGGKSALTPVVEPADATVRTLLWSSADERVAVVSRTGIVTAISVGETTITATTLDGNYTAVMTIQVTAAAQKGDINRDGYIDSGDALLALRYAVGLVELSEEQKAVADVNGDGYIDAGDAIRILRYNAGLIDKL